VSVRNTVESIDFKQPRTVAGDHGDPEILLH